MLNQVVSQFLAKQAVGPPLTLMTLETLVSSCVTFKHSKDPQPIFVLVLHSPLLDSAASKVNVI